MLTPPVVANSWTLTGVRYGLQAIDTRHRTAFRYFETGSPFEYDLVRLVYTEKRKRCRAVSEACGPADRDSSAR